MNEPEARQWLEMALSFAAADTTEVSLTGVAQASTRFANNAITQNLAKSNQTLTVKSAFGNRVGSATINQFTPEAIRCAVERAESIARLSEPDTEFLPPPARQEYTRVMAYYARTAEATPWDRADAVRAAVDLARARGLNSAGSFATDGSFHALANSRGLFAYYRQSDARFIDTVMTADSSGWAESSANDLTGIRPVQTAEIAAQKAEAARSPKEIPPGEYTVVLEPAAVAEFLAYLLWSMDAKAAHEGRSAFAGREGEQVGAPGVTIRSQPDHPECPASPIGEGGLNAPTVTWIENGTVRTLAYSRYWAEHTGRPFTGTPCNLITAGEDRSLEEIVSTVERGILVTRFWYIRMVDPMKLLLTGMTRDGLFWIEDGRVRHGLRNMRFNESPLAMLGAVAMAGRPFRSGKYFPSYVPPLKVSRFTFSSGTAF